MRGRISPVPLIPDHEVLRKIGGGSYGEVWLAQGVTGALRAVKVVRREDFEDEQGFEREFEGILKYEPMSRGHAGLVNILHVGRSAKEGEFYYYVMELGDDIRSGNKINTVEYEPRNLRTDMKAADGVPLDPDEVIDVGLRLSEALAHLHESGLAHRDIKPSNIIFVDDRPKLADIGLVAAKGQRTFVGTEGFVPPEGPGSAQADVYGLGKVLYEMATGKDRLEFPELPDEIPESANRKRWLNLNQIICDICEPRISKRSIKTAAGLAVALHRLKRGKRVRSRQSERVMKLVIMMVFLTVLGWLFRDQIPRSKNTEVTLNEPPVVKKIEYGFVKVISDPEGAEVYGGDGELIDITPFKKIKIEAGESYWFEFQLDGYRTEVKEGGVVAGETTIVEHVMAIYAPPVIGQGWVDNMGLSYQPVDNYHVSSGFIKAPQWRKFEKNFKKNTAVEFMDYRENGVKGRIVIVTPKLAEEYCRWQTAEASEGGYLTDIQYISPLIDDSFRLPASRQSAIEKGLRPFKSVVKNIPFAHLNVTTIPDTAILHINDEYRGVTPHERVRVRPGEIELTVSLEGYRRVTQKLHLKDGENKQIEIMLLRNNSVVFGQKWENSLGMQFVPVNEELLVSAWETRVSDYNVYVKTAKVKKNASPGFRQLPNHPVLQVSRGDATAFCKWLTRHERKAERISEDEEYRLLTDLEWSALCGLDENPDDLPTTREYRGDRIFPWGSVWPPELAKEKVGNFADISAARSADISRDRTLLNYNDKFAKTAPVGSFPANELGIYDLAGNAHEWVADDYSEQGKYGVLRGGGWNSYLKEHLYVTQRNAVRASKSSNLYGFRVALSKTLQSKASEFSLDDVVDDE